MADTSTTNGKPKLPPLTTKSATDDGPPKKKKVVKKKKKPTEAGEPTKDSVKDGDEPKPTPRKKKAASANSTTEAGAETTIPKKKKRVAKPVSEQEGDPSSARSATSQGEDVSGSKASLIAKGTPRKRKVKKKVKKTPEPGDAGEFFDNALAEDLSVIQDDIVTEDTKKKDKDYTSQQYSVASNVPRSQPTEKFYIETDRGFKGENKSKFAKRIAEEEAEKAIVHEEPKNTTIAFALRTHKVLRTIFLFFHGILAGMSLWHITMAYILLSFGSEDFLDHYRVLAMPVQCIFYFLLVICLVSACDRFDVGNPKRRFILRAITLQNGTISVVIYLAALILSLANSAIEDKINLRDIKPMLWNNTAVMEEDLTTWRNLNTARGSLSILGWFVLSLVPVTDRLTKNLREADDLLGDDVELGKA